MDLTYLLILMLVDEYFWVIGVFPPMKNTLHTLIPIHFLTNTIQLTLKEVNREDPSLPRKQLTKILTMKLTPQPNCKKLKSLRYVIVKIKSAWINVHLK